MSAQDSVKLLSMLGQGDRDPLDPEQWRLVTTRLAWVTKMLAEWREAQRRMDDRCGAAVEQLDEAAFDRLCDAEQAKVDAIIARLRAVADEGKWPGEMDFGGE